MSGEWIKMRRSLLRDPRVSRMAVALRSDKLRVIGGLFAVWSLADEQTKNGHLDHATVEQLDMEIGWDGFSIAMEQVKWLQATDSGIVFPRFEEHNGETAKERAQKNARQARWRASTVASTPPSTEPSTREEKRREEHTAGFVQFWEAWPKNHRKAGKSECLKLWESRSYEALSGQILAHVDFMRSTPDWQKEGGAWVPAPKVYLNQRRWDGFEVPTHDTSMPAGMIR